MKNPNHLPLPALVASVRERHIRLAQTRDKVKHHNIERRITVAALVRSALEQDTEALDRAAGVLRKVEDNLHTFRHDRAMLANGMSRDLRRVGLAYIMGGGPL